MYYINTPMAELSKAPGIDGLRTTVKVKLIKALKAEQEGKTADAEKFLAEAIAADVETPAK